MRARHACAVTVPGGASCCSRRIGLEQQWAHTLYDRDGRDPASMDATVIMKTMYMVTQSREPLAKMTRRTPPRSSNCRKQRTPATMSGRLTCRPAMPATASGNASSAAIRPSFHIGMSMTWSPAPDACRLWRGPHASMVSATCKRGCQRFGGDHGRASVMTLSGRWRTRPPTRRIWSSLWETQICRGGCTETERATRIGGGTTDMRPEEERVCGHVQYRHVGIGREGRAGQCVQRLGITSCLQGVAPRGGQAV